MVLPGEMPTGTRISPQYLEIVRVVHWTGAAWTSQAEIETVGNSDSDRPVDCAYETNGARNGYVMAVYSDDTNVR